MLTTSLCLFSSQTSIHPDVNLSPSPPVARPHSSPPSLNRIHHLPLFIPDFPRLRIPYTGKQQQWQHHSIISITAPLQCPPQHTPPTHPHDDNDDMEESQRARTSHLQTPSPSRSTAGRRLFPSIQRIRTRSPDQASLDERQVLDSCFPVIICLYPFRS